MLGVKFFVHTWNLIFRNLGVALKISVVPWLIFIGLLILFTRFGLSGANAPTIVGGNIQLGFTTKLLLLILFIIGALLTSYIAVTWHRFVLLNERLSGLMPLQPIGRLWSYIWRVIILILVMLLIFIPLFFVIAALISAIMMATGSFLLASIISSLFMGLISYISLRLSLVLPANALGKNILISESWAATRKVAGPLFITVFILVFANSVMSYLVGIIPIDIIASVADVVVQWITMMLGIGILTTLYGYCVEGRELPA